MCDCNNPKKKCQDLKRLGMIYLIINLLNGKKYVGQTIQKLEMRINQHCHKKRPGISAVIQKYGWENFRVDILEVCPVDEMNEKEIFWIAKLDTKVPNGYNLTDGGDGGRGCSPSAETLKKISDKLKGRPAHNKGKKRGKPSPETCAKISESLTGKNILRKVVKKCQNRKKHAGQRKNPKKNLDEKNLENQND